MRFSSDYDHPDYHEAHLSCRVFLEGSERSNVLYADEEGRFAITYRLDEFGKPIIKNDEFQQERFYGAVRIECPWWVRAQAEKPKQSETKSGFHWPNMPNMVP